LARKKASSLLIAITGYLIDHNRDIIGNNREHRDRRGNGICSCLMLHLRRAIMRMRVFDTALVYKGRVLGNAGLKVAHGMEMMGYVEGF